jgi:hypothetical protein
MKPGKTYASFIKKMAREIWEKDKAVILISLFLLLALVLSNHYDYRICNCTSTEKWQPGMDHGARSGVHHFYHK